MPGFEDRGLGVPGFADVRAVWTPVEKEGQ